MTKGPEAKFSQEFAAAIRQRRGIFGFRIESSHTCPGMTDWCLLIKGGRVVFIELKAGSVLTPAQAIIHRKMDELGIEHYVLTKTMNGVKVNSNKPEPLEYVIDTIVENSNVRFENDQ